MPRHDSDGNPIFYETSSFWGFEWDIKDFNPYVAEAHKKCLTRLLRSRKFPSRRAFYRKRLAVIQEYLDGAKN